MADEMADIEFVKVYVDNVPGIAEKCGITPMPTFQFYKEGEKWRAFLVLMNSKLGQLSKN